MLYWLFYEKLFRHFTPFRVFQYVTFRTAFAALTALFLCLILGPWLIAKLHEFQIGQYIREDGPKSHMKKAGTPTMGGILIIITVGESIESLRVDRDVQPGELWADRLLGRLRQGEAQTK
jgi:phospho-N-acetylmuramoyl-pentapeptide-transferase